MKKVPVVLLDGELMADSSAIISRLAAEVEALASSRWACQHSYVSERVKHAHPGAVGSACRAAGRPDLPCMVGVRPFAHLHGSVVAGQRQGWHRAVAADHCATLVHLSNCGRQLRVLQQEAGGAAATGLLVVALWRRQQEQLTAGCCCAVSAGRGAAADQAGRRRSAAAAVTPPCSRHHDSQRGGGLLAGVGGP